MWTRYLEFGHIEKPSLWTSLVTKTPDTPTALSGCSGQLMLGQHTTYRKATYISRYLQTASHHAAAHKKSIITTLMYRVKV
jgi:hypothetical protein